MTLRDHVAQDRHNEEVWDQLQCRHSWEPRPGGGAQCRCGAWWSRRELLLMAETGSPYS